MMGDRTRLRDDDQCQRYVFPRREEHRAGFIRPAPGCPMLGGPGISQARERTGTDAVAGDSKTLALRQPHAGEG